MQDVKSQMNHRFDTLETRMSGWETGMTSLETKMTGLKTGMTGVETKMLGLKTGMTSVEKKTDKITAQVAGNAEQLAATNQSLKQILDDQKSIFEVIGEHEVSIRTLRRRPV